MAEDLRIKKCWYHSGKNPHYDIPKKRIQEIKAKCILVSSKDIWNIINTPVAELVDAWTTVRDEIA